MVATLTEVKEYKVYINGDWRGSSTGEFFEVENPANGQIVAKVPKCNREDVNIAVKSAREAFNNGSWHKMSASKRGRILIQTAELVRQNLTMLAELETLTNGKPIRETKYIDVPAVADCLEYYGGMATKIIGETLPTPGNNFTYTLREPIGVVGQIIPWNFPLLMAAWKLGPALAAGNTVIIKPASYTPVTILELAKLFEQAGLPKGVLNVITGPGEEVGMAIATHPDVDKVAFTGETSTGQKIMEAAAGNVKKISLELGGKSPNIIFDDADLDEAVKGSVFAIYFNQGQVCCAGSRILVQDTIYDKFVNMFAKEAENLTVGDPMDENTHMGALASRYQRDKVNALIQEAENHGAQKIGSSCTTTDPNGYYVMPTALVNVNNDMKVLNEEIFGPVACIQKFSNEDEAAYMANDTKYGLAAGLWTRDVKRAHRFAGKIKAGTVWVNTYNQLFNEAPFGGYKQSGIGRELGQNAIDLYTEVKTVCVNLDEKPIRWYDRR